MKIFNQDRITSLIAERTRHISNAYKENHINALTAHCRVKKIIKDIYQSNDISYEDVCKRKYKLTKFNPSLINIGISFIMGLAATHFFELSKNITNGINQLPLKFQPIISMLTMLVCVFILIIFFIKTTKHLTPKDKYETNDFELNLINQKLLYFEQQNETHHLNKN